LKYWTLCQNFRLFSWIYWAFFVMAFQNIVSNFFDMISLKYCLSIDESLIEELLSDINMHWQQQHYNAMISAIKINGTSIIPNIVDCAPFCWVFEHRANKEIMLLSNSKMWLIVWLCYFLVHIFFFLSIKAAASHHGWLLLFMMKSTKRMASV